MNPFVLAVGMGAAVFSVTTLAGHVTIVSEDQAPKTWTLASGQPRVPAGYPAATTDKRRDVCVNIGYLIGSDGRTSNFTRMKTWSSDEGKELQAYIQAAAAAVSASRFVPATTRAHPIYTSSTFAFVGSKLLSVEDVHARCHIADLADHVDQAMVATTNRRWIFRRSDKLRPSDARAIEPYHVDY